ncbi:MAG: hypothetical protein GY814_14995 [Gammaproteobacteria bacterium]|nr:hypothetical protein [Gammaproteobacteria bacterium]
MADEEQKSGSLCNVRQVADYTGVTIVELSPEPPLEDYLQAMELANSKAQQLVGNHMLLSWYDRDRDFESPQHCSECHSANATPGYVDYALYRDARLKIDIENGRFIFFYLPLDL